MGGPNGIGRWFRSNNRFHVKGFTAFCFCAELFNRIERSSRCCPWPWREPAAVTRYQKCYGPLGRKLKGPFFYSCSCLSRPTMAAALRFVAAETHPMRLCALLRFDCVGAWSSEPAVQDPAVASCLLRSTRKITIDPPPLAMRGGRIGYGGMRCFDTKVISPYRRSAPPPRFDSFWAPATHDLVSHVVQTQSIRRVRMRNPFAERPTIESNGKRYR